MLFSDWPTPLKTVSHWLTMLQDSGTPSPSPSNLRHSSCDWDETVIRRGTCNGSNIFPHFIFVLMLMKYFRNVEQEILLSLDRNSPIIWKTNFFTVLVLRNPSLKIILIKWFQFSFHFALLSYFRNIKTPIYFIGYLFTPLGRDSAICWFAGWHCETNFAKKV